MKAWIFFASALLITSVGWSHALLLNPPPRANIDGVKTGPCGVAKTATPTVLTMGSTLNVQWRETIDHPGYYRLYVTTTSNDAELDIAANQIPGDIPDVQIMGANNPLPHNYSRTITLPNVACDNCTLRMVQFMTEANPPSLYYSCADIRLVPVGGATPTPGGGQGKQSSSSQDNSQPSMSSCGSMAGGSQASAGFFFWWSLPSLVFLRRRKK